MSWSTKFEPNQIKCLSANTRKLINQPEARNSRISVEHDQQWTSDGEAHNELTNQIGAQTDQWFVCKCMETAQPIRSQEIVKIQWSVIAKS